jgi:histone H3/H4
MSTLEEEASKVRDRFNFLVKQYKKYEKKKISGSEAFIVEREEIKKMLSLFFKEYGGFIRTRKNSFGTFDYDSYLLHLRKEEGHYTKPNPVVDNYGELYSQDRERQFAPQDDFIRSNRIEYKRPYPLDYPMRHHHTEFVSGYYKNKSNFNNSPNLPMSPNLISSNPTPFNSTQKSNFYEQYVNKKVTVYDFIRNEKTQAPQEKTLYRSPVQKSVITQQLHPQVNNIFNNNPPFIKPSTGKYTNTNLFSTTNLANNSNNSYSNSNSYSNNNSYTTNSYSNFNQPTYPNNPIPSNTPIYSNSQFPPPPSSSSSSSTQFSPDFRSFRPPQFGNTPLWKNQFAQMDTAKLQGRVIPHQNFIRSNTYNTIKKPQKKVINESKKVKIEEQPLNQSLSQSINIPSSSTSEDYQKYFLEDLLKETGSDFKMSQNVSDFLYEFCDNFFEHLLLMSCALTSNGKKKSVCVKDVKMILKMEFGIQMPEESSK